MLQTPLQAQVDTLIKRIKVRSTSDPNRSLIQNVSLLGLPLF